MTSNPAQLRYLADTVSTASPARRIVMLYDRMLLDLARAAAAQAEGDRFAASPHILHAQQIIAELSSSLRPEAWAGADNLASLYAWVLRELSAVNLAPSTARITAVTKLVSDLRNAWHDASEQLNQPVVESASVARPAAWVS